MQSQQAAIASLAESILMQAPLTSQPAREAASALAVVAGRTHAVQCLLAAHSRTLRRRLAGLHKGSHIGMPFRLLLSC